MKAGCSSSSLARVICFVALSCATEVGLSAQAGDPWCRAFQRLLAAGRDGFDSVSPEHQERAVALFSLVSGES